MALKDVQLEFAGLKADNTEIRSLLDGLKISDSLGTVYFQLFHVLLNR